jgi:hypothetical protein
LSLSNTLPTQTDFVLFFTIWFLVAVMIAWLENTTKLSNNQPVPVAMQASTNQMMVHKSIVQTAPKESMEIFPVPMPNLIVKIVQLGGMAQNLVKPARAIAANVREVHGVALLVQALLPRAQNV